MNSDTKTKAQPQDSEETEAETDKARFEKDYILETGSVLRAKGRHAIHCLTVIGQIEGHSIAPQTQKTTKYEHVIPQLVSIEEDPEVEGLLVILNTVGGDVEAGLALAELISGITKPSATLVLGGGPFHRHSACCISTAQLHRAHGHHDGAPGASLGPGAGCAPDHALFRADAAAHYGLCGGPFPYQRGAFHRIDDAHG